MNSGSFRKCSGTLAVLEGGESLSFCLVDATNNDGLRVAPMLSLRIDEESLLADEENGDDIMTV
jgi:hypothetical protein